MYSTKDNTISGYDSSQLYYPVGPDNDSYTLGTWFEYNITTGLTDVHSEAILNWSYSVPTRRVICKSTPAECIAAIELAVEPFRKQMELYRIRKKAEYSKISDTYKLTDGEQIIFDMGDAYLTQ